MKAAQTGHSNISGFFQTYQPPNPSQAKPIMGVLPRTMAPPPALVLPGAQPPSLSLPTKPNPPSNNNVSHPVNHDPEANLPPKNPLSPEHGISLKKLVKVFCSN